MRDRLTRQATQAALARERAAQTPPPAPLCSWCHSRPPADTAGMCQACRDGISGEAP